MKVYEGKDIRNLVAMGIIMDLVFQVVLYRSVHPGAALVVGPILICVPYTLSRALTTCVTRGSTSGISNAAFLRERNCGRREKR